MAQGAARLAAKPRALHTSLMSSLSPHAGPVALFLTLFHCRAPLTFRPRWPRALPAWRPAWTTPHWTSPARRVSRCCPLQAACGSCCRSDPVTPCRTAGTAFTCRCRRIRCRCCCRSAGFCCRALPHPAAHRPRSCRAVQAVEVPGSGGWLAGALKQPSTRRGGLATADRLQAGCTTARQRLASVRAC